MINTLLCPYERNPLQCADAESLMSTPTVSCVQKHLEKQEAGVL